MPGEEWCQICRLIAGEIKPSDLGYLCARLEG